MPRWSLPVAIGVLLATAVTLAGPPQAGLATVDREIRAGTYGNVDALYVMRDARVIADHLYSRDYREISRGRTGPIGCGFGCADPTFRS